VRKSDTELVNKFGIKTYPTLMVVTDEYNGDIYKGELKK
jgi:hypothetical protein